MKIIVSVPAELKDFLAEQSKAKGFKEPADYLLDLLRLAKAAQVNVDLDRKFLDSLGSGMPFKDEGDFDETIRD